MRIDYSAYPTTEEHMNGGAGLSVRELAAIQLRVPDSGDEKIDAMIRQANRRDFAGQALAGLLANPSVQSWDEKAETPCELAEACALQSVLLADALLAQLEESK